MSEQQYSGFFAIVGRPNVGKSTLVNQIIGHTVSIVCRKRQTTRHNILGIKTQGKQQMIFVDTPGIHQEHGSDQLNRYMNQQACLALQDVEAVVWMIDHHWREADEAILQRLKKTLSRQQPVILVINKIDQLKDKSCLLPLIEHCQNKLLFDHIIPISAQDPKSVNYLETLLQPYLVQHPFFFPEDYSTDRSQRFQMAEFIREQFFSFLNDELPYGLTVYIENLEKEPDIWHVDAIILVTSDSHKRIVIGQGGRQLKLVGQKARSQIEKHLGHQVYLQLWVKIKQDWYNSDYWLNQIDQQ